VDRVKTINQTETLGAIGKLNGQFYVWYGLRKLKNRCQCNLHYCLVPPQPLLPGAVFCSCIPPVPDLVAFPSPFTGSFFCSPVLTALG
jgi:hypothetical protein